MRSEFIGMPGSMGHSRDVEKPSHTFQRMDCYSHMTYEEPEVLRMVKVLAQGLTLKNWSWNSNSGPADRCWVLSAAPGPGPPSCLHPATGRKNRQTDK